MDTTIAMPTGNAGTRRSLPASHHDPRFRRQRRRTPRLRRRHPLPGAPPAARARRHDSRARRRARRPPLHGLEQLQHAGVLGQRRQLDHRGPDHRPVRRDAREAAVDGLRVHQHRRRRGTAAPTSTAGPCRARRCTRTVCRRSSTTSTRNGQKVGLYAIPGISPAVYDADLPDLRRPRLLRRATSPSSRSSKADYWGIGYRIDFANPCAQAYVDSIADLFGEWGIDFLKFDSVTPGSGISDLSLDARDDVEALVAGARAAQASGSSSPGPSTSTTPTTGSRARQRLAGRLGRRVLLRGRGAHGLAEHRAPLPAARPTGGATPDRAAGTTSTRSTSATARWTG